LQSSPEWIQGISAFALADEDYGARFQIHHDGQVLVALANANLINGDLFEFMQLRPAEAPFQISFLDIFDDIPADAQMTATVKDGRQFRQFKNVSFKTAGIAPSPPGKTQLDLPDDAADQTLDPRHSELDEHGFNANRNCSKPAQLFATAYDASGAAHRTAQITCALIDGKDHCPFLIAAVHILVAVNPEGMIQ